MQRALSNVNLTLASQRAMAFIGVLIHIMVRQYVVEEEDSIILHCERHVPELHHSSDTFGGLALSEGLFDTFTSVLWRVYRYRPSPRQISSFLEGQPASIIYIIFLPSISLLNIDLPTANET